MLNKNYLKPFLVSTAAGTVLSVSSVIVTSSNSAIPSPIMAWVYSVDLFAFIYPLFCTVPYCITLFCECRNNFHYFTHCRIKTEKLLKSHLVTGLLCAFTGLFIISFAGAAASMFISSNFSNQRNIASEYYLGSLLAELPMFYAFLISVWRGIIGAALYFLSYVLTTNTKHLFAALTGGFVYTLLENFVTAVLGVSNFSLVYSFCPEILNWTGFSVPPYVSTVAALALLIGFSLLLGFAFKRRKEKSEQ